MGHGYLRDSIETRMSNLFAYYKTYISSLITPEIVFPSFMTYD